MSQLESALKKIRTARLYALDLLSHISEDDWFRQPAEGVTHVAWQIGHLAVAQFGLALKRVRGETVEDAQLISPAFRKLYGKGSVPVCEKEENPSPDEIRAVRDRVYQRVLFEISALPQESVSEPTGDPPHPMFNTKLGALHWCAQHEFIHAGQIALLRRLFGAKPLR